MWFKRIIYAISQSITHAQGNKDTYKFGTSPLHMPLYRTATDHIACHLNIVHVYKT